MQKYYLVMNHEIPLHVCLTEEAANKQKEVEYNKERLSALESYKEESLVDCHMWLCNFKVAPVDGQVLASCFGKLIPADEPSFTLRASDSSAPLFVEFWRAKHEDRLGSNHPKIVSARNIADRMIEWANTKLPD